MLNKTIGNPPPEHIPVSVPFELSIVAGQDIGWVNSKICEIAASGPVTVRSSPAVGVRVVKLAGAGREPTEHFKNLRLHGC